MLPRNWCLCQASSYSRCMGKKQWIKLAWLVGGLYLCLVLGRSLWELVRAEGRVDQARVELGKLQAEGQKLKLRLDEVQTPDFVEKEARDVLGLQKPNEKVIIVPELKLPKTPLDLDSKKVGEAIWEKWVDLFR